MLSKEQLNAAQGALMGGMCGDAAGATLEFIGNFDERAARNALTMPGGGVFRVGPGQLTDDTELMLGLLHGLKGQDPFKPFPLEAVASRYMDWYQSPPFDIGNTCSTAFSVERPQDMQAQAARYNMGSEANGALMRAGPIAVWCVLHGVTDNSIVAAHARADASLSHCSQVCQDANALFCVAIAHLIRHPGDSKGAVLAVEALISKETIHPTVLGWWADSNDTGVINRMCTPNIGHAKHAFSLAMHLLRFSKDSFEDAMFKVLMLHGDTDTNAAICGYIMGALKGFDGIPEFMKMPVLTFNCSHPAKGRQRPATYRAMNALSLISEMLDGDKESQEEEASGDQANSCAIS